MIKILRFVFIKTGHFLLDRPLSTLCDAIVQVIQRPRERGTFTVNRAYCGAPRRSRTPNFEEHRVEESRTIAREMGVPHNTVCEVLHEQQLQPSRSQRVHVMGPSDFALCAIEAKKKVYRRLMQRHGPTPHKAGALNLATQQET